MKGGWVSGRFGASFGVVVVVWYNMGVIVVTPMDGGEVGVVPKTAAFGV